METGPVSAQKAGSGVTTKLPLGREPQQGPTPGTPHTSFQDKTHSSFQLGFPALLLPAVPGSPRPAAEAGRAGG